MTTDPIDFERLLRETSLRSYQYFATVESTNTLALTDIRPAHELPHLILADQQTAGRGRGGNAWWSTAGALTCTLIVDPAHWNLPRARLPLLSLGVGLAVAQAVEICLTDRLRTAPTDTPRPAWRVDLKWPNDVYLNDRKWGGILIESLTHHPDRLAIGVGLNVNNSLAHSPVDVQQRAISLIDLLNKSLPRTDLVSQVLRELDNCLELLARDPDQLMERYRRRCWLTGKHILISTPQETVAGNCSGVDDRGALCFITENGDRSVLAGTVTVLSDHAER